MPLYEYECKQCHKRTEKRQKFSDPEITECPHCGGHIERVISAPAVSFKGGGWYKDLYSSAKAPASPSNGGGEAAPSTSNTPAASNGDSSNGNGAKPSAPAAAPAAPAAASTSTTKS